MAQKKILTAGNMAGILHSEVLDLNNINLGSIQAVFIGAPVGVLQLEISNDIIAASADPNAAVLNWDPYGSSFNVVAAGHQTFNISNMGYKWCRLTYTPSAGAGTLDMTAEIKS